MKRLIMAMMVIVAMNMPANAQDPEVPPLDTDDPISVATVFYDQLLNGTPEQFGALSTQFLCPEFVVTVEEVDYWYRLLAGNAVDVTTLTFTPSETIVDTLDMGIEGDVTITASDDSTIAPVVTTPESLTMVYAQGWRICPSGEFFIQLNAASDEDLTESQAVEATIAFYNAFYTHDLEGMAAITCAALVRHNWDAIVNNYEIGFTVDSDSQWNFTVAENERGYAVNTTGILELSRGEDRIGVDTRGDFQGAQLIQEDGWKFCTPYREMQTVVETYLTTYFGDGDVRFLSCQEHRNTLIGEAAEWSFTVEQVSIPDGAFVDNDPTDATVQLTRLQALIVVGDEVVSLASVFPEPVTIIREGNRWVWCTPPIGVEPAP